jgi:hypothetical protein
MKKYQVSYYCTGSHRFKRYFDTINEALHFSVHGLRHPEAFFGIDLIEDYYDNAS